MSESNIRAAVISPDPTDTFQGLEKFCHLLTSSLAGHDIEVRVVGASDPFVEASHVVVTNGMYATRVSKPRIHVYHGCAPFQAKNSHAESSKNWRIRNAGVTAYREFLAGASATIRVSVSRGCKNEVQRAYRLSSIQITNGVDVDTFTARSRLEARHRLGIDPGERMALFVGRPEWRKRPDIALAAAEVCGYQLYVAGSGGYASSRWLGRLNETKLVDALSAADVVLMPTMYEACSLALLESVSTGALTLTTDAGWTPELLESVPAYASLVSPAGDLAGFCDALSEANRHQEAMREASHYVRTHHDLEQFGLRWSRLIRGLAS